MSVTEAQADLSRPGDEFIQSYIHATPLPEQPSKGTIVILHGFPETNYQFRKVTPLFTAAGYSVIAPDCRGAGKSSITPVSTNSTAYTKRSLANDLLHLLDHLHLTDPIHLIAHDMGAHIAIHFALLHPDRLASLIWGEALIPGTSTWTAVQGSPLLWHMNFHRAPELPETLTRGNESAYLSYLHYRSSYDKTATSPADLAVYTAAYAQPYAMSAGFELYRSFETDMEQLQESLRGGKCKVPSLILHGGKGPIAKMEIARNMCVEIHDEGAWETDLVAGAGHYVAEEDPVDFVRAATAFWQRRGL